MFTDIDPTMNFAVIMKTPQASNVKPLFENNVRAVQGYTYK